MRIDILGNSHPYAFSHTECVDCPMNYPEQEISLMIFRELTETGVPIVDVTRPTAILVYSLVGQVNGRPQYEFTKEL